MVIALTTLLAEDFLGLSWWMILLVGTAVGVVLQIFLQGIMPRKFKERTLYWGRELEKRVHPPKINVKLIAKTASISDKKLELEPGIEFT